MDKRPLRRPPRNTVHRPTVRDCPLSSSPPPQPTDDPPALLAPALDLGLYLCRSVKSGLVLPTMPCIPLNRTWTTDGQSESVSAHIGLGRKVLGRVRPASAGKSALSRPWSAGRPGSSGRPGSGGRGASSGRLGGGIRPSSSGIHNSNERALFKRPGSSGRPSSSGTFDSRVLYTRHARAGSNVGVRHMRIGSEWGDQSDSGPALTDPKPTRIIPTSTLAPGRSVTPPGGAFPIPVSGGSRREDSHWNRGSRTEEDSVDRQGDLTEPAEEEEKEVPSHRDGVRNDPTTPTPPLDRPDFFQINSGSSDFFYSQPRFSPFLDGSGFSQVDLTRFEAVGCGRFVPPQRGLEVVWSRTGTTSTMGFLDRPGTGSSLRSMTFPRAVMSDVELRSEWSSSEDGRSLRTLKLSPPRLRKPRWTVETDRPRRSQSERSRWTTESERPRQSETDRPSVDQRRFPSLLRVRERTRVISAPSEPEPGVLESDKPKRGSWLANIRLRASNASSRAPTPSSVPILAPIPSLSPITPLGPIFHLSPATPGEKSIFGTGEEGEGICSQPVPESEPWSRVTPGSQSGSSEHEPRYDKMLSRASSGKAIPPRPPQPSRPIPSTPEFILPDDRRQREATIRPSSRSRPPSATEFGMNGDPYAHQDKPSFLDELDVASDSDDHYYGEEVPPGTATTADEPRIAGMHRAQLSISSRVPISESNIRWSAAGRSRSNSGASAGQWRGASVYVDDEQDDEARYGLPSPCVPQDPDDGVMSNGEYGGIVGPRRDLYSDDELESVLEENESDCDHDHDREDRTEAMIIADEGRGLIVDAEARPLSQLDVQTGTTHLLLGNSPNPSNVPTFLAQVLPQISTTLLCLDISNNELGSLPPALSSCTQLEELNVSHNPLRSLPSSLGALVSLRVLIADSCDLQSLPSQLVNLGALHSLSVRSNRLVMLPVWMCAMPGLEVLKIEGNTFAGPWKNLVEPLLPRDANYTPSPPNHVYTAARAANSLPLLSTTTTSNGSMLASPISLGRPSGVQRSYSQQPQPSSAIDPRWSANTSPIPSPYPTSNSAPHSPPRSALSPPPAVMMSPPPATGLAHLQLPIQSPPTTAAKLNMHLGALAPAPRRKKKRAGGGSISGSEIMTTDAESEVEASTSWASAPRRMKSADELRRMGNPEHEGAPPSAPILSSPPTLPEPQQAQVKRYMSLGVRGSPSNRPDARQMWAGGSARNSTASASRNSTGPRGSRYSATGLQGQKVEEDEVSPDVSYEFGAAGGEDDHPPSIARAASDERVGQRYSGVEDAYAHVKASGALPEEQRRKGRWGFLKKVSMGRLRSHSNSERLGRTLPPAQLGSMPAVPTRPQPIPPPAPPRVDVTSAGSPASSVLTARVLQENLNGGAPSPGLLQPIPSPVPPRAKRRSFLPFDTPPTLNIPIPSGEPFMPNVVALGEGETLEEDAVAAEEAQRRADEEAARQQLALRGIMSYLRDMADLEGGMGAGLVASRRPPLTQYMDGRTKSDGSYASSTSTPPMLRSAPSTASLRGGQDSVNTTDSSGSYGQFAEDRKYKDDKGRRVAIVREIIETEKSYVKGLQELLDIYVKPASEPAPGLNVNKETTIPAAERKIVFTGVDALLQFHKQSFLPSLITAAEILSTAGPGEDVSTRAAHSVANVFVSHAAFMKMYFTYINNFDNAIQRLQFWSAPPSAPNTPGTTTPAPNAPTTVGVGLSMVAMGVAGVAPDQPHTATLNAGQRKRIKQFLKRSRLHPRHSQLNLEGYLLLPIQRIPRYKMLLDNLVTCTPPHSDSRDDPLERALEEIAVLASSMNEGKRESESRTKLVQWQSRIKGKFISPLVQPHRRLIMDGRLQLVRLVKKVNSRADVPNPDGSLGQVEVPCLSSDANPKQLVAILCNDLLVLCKELPGMEQVELWAVLRMQTMAQPASIVSGNGLRIVDNKAILYFNTQSTSEALTWQRAINLHIPHSQ